MDSKTRPSQSSVSHFQTYRRQLEASDLLRSAQRHTLLVGGSRSGKTTLLVHEIAKRALAADESRHAILRLHANAARASIALDTLPKCFALVSGRAAQAAPYRGLFLAGERLGNLDRRPRRQERVEKILGKEYATIFLNECSQIPYASVLVALTRLAQVVERLAAGRLLRSQPGQQGPLDQRAVRRKARSDLAPAAGQSGRLRADVSQSGRQCRQPDEGVSRRAWSGCRSGSASDSSKASISTISTARCSATR